MMSEECNRDFTTLVNLEAFILDGVEEELDKLSDEDVAKSLKKLGINTDQMVNQVKDSVRGKDDG